MENSQPKIYSLFLFAPALGFFTQDKTIIDHAHFLLVIALIISSYLCYHSAFKSSILNEVRKCVGCLSTALLITYLSAQVSDILSNVYKVAYHDQISFFIKIVFMISNMEGNLDLCVDHSECKYKESAWISAI